MHGSHFEVQQLSDNALGLISGGALGGDPDEGGQVHTGIIAILIGMASPRDAQSGQAAGKRMHSPLFVMK